MLFSYLQALLIVQHASALAQTPFDPQIELAVAECKRREQLHGGCFVPTPTREGGWDCIVCKGSSCKIFNCGGESLTCRWRCKTKRRWAFADIHPKTGLRACCEAGTSWTTDPVHHLEGKCCSADEKFRFDTAVMRGDCVDVKKSLAAAEGSRTAIDNDCPDCPQRPIGCPTDGTLPIRYGRCYTVSSVAGNPWARSSLYYYSGGTLGEYKEVIFRICNSTTSCNTRSGEYVPKGGRWYQLDLTRVRDQSSAEPNWVGSSSVWLARVDITSASNLIANFVANSTCISGQCALCLRVAKDVGSNGANHGLSLYAVGNEAIQFSANPVSCYPAVYQEAHCLDSTSSSLNP